MRGLQLRTREPYRGNLRDTATLTGRVGGGWNELHRSPHETARADLILDIQERRWIWLLISFALQSMAVLGYWHYATHESSGGGQY